MKYYLCVLFLLTHPPKQQIEPVKTIDLKPVEITYKKTVKDYCLDIANKLDSIGYLSVSPQEFANFLYIVGKCESSHEVNAKNGDQNGLWQMTEPTRLKLHLKRGGIKVQAYNHFIFIKTLGKKRVRSIKNSVDLHCYNFAPYRDKDGVLSKVTNDGLKALDFNKDSLITREDLFLFQKRNGKP